ncbi:sulfite exporter TauE/SafE family protein [Ideonella sp. DXS29W]|uniref:Sulfite exporter TauE/SafE family protein n=1 Tax=Ideonella lacteola TaxID=2984193 RepID=A0ABU9BTQ3_9BURK
MNGALVLTALLMGLAGSVHCVAMCAAPSAAGVRACGAGRREGWAAFHAGRLVAYTLAGALAAASVGAVSRWSALSPALRPIWAVLHVAALALGLWLLVRGRQPEWLERAGRTPTSAARPDAQGWQRMRGPVKAGGLGLAWVTWPCGLLQSALVVAALANDSMGGAAVMLVFGLATAPALGVAPWLWARWSAASGRSITAGVEAGAIRLAGALLAGASVWALGHDVLTRLVAFCLS